MALSESLREGFNHKEISRKRFLVLAAGAMAGTASFYPPGIKTENKITQITDVFFDQSKEWENATLDNRKFVEKNKQWIKNTSFGFSFSPEEMSGISRENFRTENGKIMGTKNLEALKFMHEDLGISEIRLGVRWKNSVDEKGNFDFSFYKPYFDYCLKNDMKVSLNFGIKVFRWPEDHVPEKLLKDTPKNKSELTMKDDLTKESINFSKELLTHFKNGYTEKELRNIYELQPENEAFHMFGEHEWTMGDDYLVSLVSLSESILPGRKILYNSSEFTDLNRIYGLFSKLSNFIDKERLTLGIDYYPFCPSDPLEPVLGHRLESLIPGQKTLGDFKQQGYSLPELSEIQAEPWNNLPFPKDNLTSLKYITQRSYEDILNGSGGSTLRYWGFEYLMNSDEKISLPVFDLFKKISDVKADNNRRF